MKPLHVVSRSFALLGVALLAVACPGEDVDGGVSPDVATPDVAEPDAGVTDGGEPEAPTPETPTPDAGPPNDAGTPNDAGPPDDAGTPNDAGAREDAGQPGEDAGAPGEDAGRPGDDAGQPGDDAGTPGVDGGGPGEDGGQPFDDGGVVVGDAGQPVEDAGVPNGVGLDVRPSNTTCVAPERPPSGADVALTRVFPSLSFVQAIDLLQAPNDNSEFYVVIKQGTVERWANDNGADTTETFLDVSDRIIAPGGNDERGLLGMAFHPDYPTVSEVYIHTIRSPSVSVFSRVPIVNGIADVDNEEIILEVNQPAGNHNGGDLKFGPDGYLYGSIGDGGGGGDPFGNGQNRNTLLGTIFRIDIDSPPDPGLAYAIPPTNPDPAGLLGRPEIYAFGLRNVWRMSFDPVTGDLWAADVGQNAYEEVNIIESGGNYGWPIMEGFHCFNAATCDMAPYELPQTEYPHALGRSITGGHVYRGGNIPGLEGVFIYGDFVTGRLFGAFPDVEGGFENQQLGLQASNIAAFSTDQNGALYVLTYAAGIFRLDPDGSPPPSPLPRLLTETGCVDANDATVLAPGVIPYNVNVPFWSDGAVKERAFAIPDGETASIDADGDFDFPIGTVTMKTFFRAGERLETRLLVRHDDGGWGGYVYRWRSDQSDADLLETGLVDTAPGGTWTFPGRETCLQCHTAAAGRTLGLTVAQLNGPETYPQTGRTADQLATLESVGLVTGLGAGPHDALPDPFGPAPLDDRVRAYLDVNCAACHQPTGPVQTDIDLRESVTTEEMNVCHQFPKAGDLGIAGARIIDPSNPATSVLFQRMGLRDANGMPPLASLIPDVQGQALIGEWLDTDVCDGIDRPEPPAEPGTCAVPTPFDIDLTNGGASVTVTGSTQGLPNNESGTCGGGDASDWVYELVPNATTVVCIDTLGSSLDTLLHVREGACAIGSEIGCNDDITFGVETNSRVQATATSGTPLYIVVDGYSGAGAFQLTVTEGACP